jgi:hypothetical protein
MLAFVLSLLMYSPRGHETDDGRKIEEDCQRPITVKVVFSFATT